MGLTCAHSKNKTTNCDVSEDTPGVFSPQTRVIAFTRKRFRNKNASILIHHKHIPRNPLETSIKNLRKQRNRLRRCHPFTPAAQQFDNQR